LLAVDIVAAPAERSAPPPKRSPTFVGHMRNV